MQTQVNILDTNVTSTKQVTFNGSATSSAVNLGSQSLISLDIPASMAGTSLTFTSSDTQNGTYTQLRDGPTGSAVTFTITSTAGTYASGVYLQALAGLKPWVKIVSSTSETGKTITLNTRVV